ncbi:MAG: hypothetical protein COB78_09955 [Hyphomicrobiales bacterium]|nr:MAG: hypothetical protein COB78_09955 [Hyphomicrobiales bacterium]
MSYFEQEFEELEIRIDGCVIGHCDAEVEFDQDGTDGEISVTKITIESAVKDHLNAQTILAPSNRECVLFDGLAASAISRLEHKRPSDPNREHRIAHSQYGFAGRAS